MLLFQLDPASAEPKYRQIIAQVTAAIAGGALRPGDRLPSTRRLADQLCLHRSTIATAYQELWSLGYIDYRPGARPQVRARAPIMTTAPAEPVMPMNLIDWSTAAGSASDALLATYRAHGHRRAAARGIIDFSQLDMDPRLLPVTAFRLGLNDALQRHGDGLFGYGDVAGFPPLREFVAQRLTTHGIAVTTDEVLLTSGSQQALDLVLRLIAAPGRAVVVESPTYDCVLPLLQLNGLRPLPVPLNADGMDLDALAGVLDRERPALVYTMPTFQNPTGVSTNQAHRERLLALCEAHRLPILEDGFDEEMKYFGRVVLPLKSMDRRQSVIYCGTFSKVLLPGVRVGWLAADRDCVERLIAIRRYTDLTANLILQAALHELCQSGAYDRHLSKMHRVFRKRMATALNTLQRELDPALAEWSEPTGGYLLWLRLKTRATGTDVLARCLAAGVRVMPGDGFFLPGTAPATPCLRLSISRLDEAEISEGVRRLASVLRQLHAEEGMPR